LRLNTIYCESLFGAELSRSHPAARAPIRPIPPRCPHHILQAIPQVHLVSRADHPVRLHDVDWAMRHEWGWAVVERGEPAPCNTSKGGVLGTGVRGILGGRSWSWGTLSRVCRVACTHIWLAPIFGLDTWQALWPTTKPPPSHYCTPSACPALACLCLPGTLPGTLYGCTSSKPLPLCTPSACRSRSRS
jgi:hypothetical protein